MNLSPYLFTLSLTAGNISLNCGSGLPMHPCDHTIIALLICDKNKRILYFGNIYLGSTVDFAIFKKELMAFNFEQIRVWVDLGFVGIKGVLGEKVDVQIGHKKSKKHPLTDEQKLENQALARQRIVIENSIGSVKRYNILKHEVRLKKPEKNKNLHMAMEICVGLSNFKLKCYENEKAKNK